MELGRVGGVVVTFDACVPRYWAATVLSAYANVSSASAGLIICLAISCCAERRNG
jgi:hypothetical protein